MSRSSMESVTSSRRSSVTIENTRRRSIRLSGSDAPLGRPASPPLVGGFTFTKKFPLSPVPDASPNPAFDSPYTTPLVPQGSPFIAVDFDSEGEERPHIGAPASPVHFARKSWQTRAASFWRVNRAALLSRRALLLVFIAFTTVTTLVNSMLRGSASTMMPDDSNKYFEAMTGASGRLRDAVTSFTPWGATPGSQEGYFKSLDPRLVLQSPEPQAKAKLGSQLKTGIRYVTALGYGGHTNQLMALGKLLYIAKLTKRVALIPTLLPIHIAGQPQNVSDFYDLPRLYHETSIPAVEWWRVKTYDPSGSPNDEGISCWSSQEATVGHANLQQWSTDLHNTWVVNWALPPMLRALGGFDIAYDAIRMFDFGERGKWEWTEKVKREGLPKSADDKSNSVALKPGFDISAPTPTEQLLCFDNTLFFGPIDFPEPFPADPPMEDYVPGEGISWREVNQHLHFTPDVERNVDTFLMRLFAVSQPSQIPPFLTVHLRRGDFKEFAGLTALDKYVAAHKRLVAKLQARLDAPDSWQGPGRQNFKMFGRRAEDYAVVTTTDEETGSPFLDEVKALGWKVLDHGALGTAEQLGPWWPTILDSSVLARGQGFVGTDRSTFSHLAGLRVKYWHGGLVETAL